MNNKQEYANLWKKDSSKLYSDGLYDWMTENINSYKNVLEIGCGAGFSTLCLLQKGHNVISVEFNDYCIEMTQRLLKENGYSDIKIIKYKISESNYMQLIEKLREKIDIVICWNPGGVDSLSEIDIKETIEDMRLQGYQNPEVGFASNFSETLIRCACIIGQILNVDTHIIDRDLDEYMNIADYINIKEYNVHNIIENKIKGMSNQNTMNIEEEIWYKSFLLKR